MIDTHTHIFLEEFDDDRAEVVLRARAAGVSAVVLPNVDVATIAPLRRMLCAFPDFCVVAMGLHPTSVGEHFEQDLEIIKNELDKGTFTAVGEVGLDFYWDKTYAREQEIALRRQTEWAIERNLPLILHVRDAFADTCRILSGYDSHALRGVFHSFSGTPDEAEKIFSLGNFKLGINGIVTFKNSAWRDALPAIGLENLLLETDAPYLAPVPFRGKRNEPAHVALVAQKLAEVFGVEPARVDEVTTRNARALFFGGRQK